MDPGAHGFEDQANKKSKDKKQDGPCVARGLNPNALARLRPGSDAVAADVRGENIVQAKIAECVGKAGDPAQQKRQPRLFTFF